jgi:CxxC motif-containing protein
MSDIIRLTCIECPLGCDIEVQKENEELKITGNSCPRGKLYATNEVTCPKRVLTTTVRCCDGGLVAVKTSAPVNKSDLLDLMNVINKTVASLPVRIGDVIIENLVDGVNLIATDNREVK